MIDTEALRKHTLDLATHGELSRNVRCAENANSLYAHIQLVREKLTESKQLKNNEVVQPLVKNEPYKLPSNWKWVCMGNIFNIVSARRVHKADWRQEGIPFYRAREISKLAKFGEVRNDLFIDNSLYEKFAKSGVPQPGDLMVTAVGTLGQTYVVKKKDKFYYKDASVLCLENYGNLVPEYVKIVMDSPMMADQINNNTFGTTVRTLTIAKLNRYFFPLPPLEEQLKIVESIKEIFNQLEVIDTFQSQYTTNISALNKKILELAVHGKLVPQNPSDEPASVLLEKIEEHIAKDKLPENEPFVIPSNWCWVKLGWILKIERGGSPRPIKSYLTDDKDGINWIKIGDVEKNGKYISHTKEKILPEGAKKSREVFPGDFLLTNSMSFGRPYISKINGCVHDGWLILRDTDHLFIYDFLYYLLSSDFVFRQFKKKASGSTVDNLNIEKVSNAIVPVPPVEEQKRICIKLDEILLNIK